MRLLWCSLLTYLATPSLQEKKIVLTMDDLSSALTEYGLNVKKPEYYQ